MTMTEASIYQSIVANAGRAIDTIKGYKEIEVFKVKTYPVLNDICGLRETAFNIDETIKRVFLGHAKLALVGCGTSGASLMTAISIISDLDCGIIHKDTNKEHSHRPRITIVIRYNHLIVVDDRIETGDTMRTISESLKREGDFHLKVKMVCAIHANEKRELLKELFPNCKYFCY